IASATTGGRAWILGVRQYWDYLALRWNQLIVQYDLYSQLRALEGLQRSSDDLAARLSAWWLRHRAKDAHAAAAAMPVAARKRGGPLENKRARMYACVLASFAALGLWQVRKANRRTEAKEIAEYRRFLSRMARHGFPKRASETGREYARRLGRERPDQEPAAGGI